MALLLSAVTVGGAQAQTEAEAVPEGEQEARHLFEAGRRAFDDGRFEEALDLFQRSYERSGRAALLFNIGTTADRLRDNRLALESFEQYLEEVPDPPNRRNVEARIEVLRRELEAADARTADAGEADAPDASSAAVDASGSGERRPLTWITGGLALASVGASIVFWALASSRYDELVDECAARRCSQDDVSGVDTLVTLTNVGIGAGIGSFVASVALFFFEPDLWADEDEGAAVSVELGPAALRLRGRF